MLRRAILVAALSLFFAALAGSWASAAPLPPAAGDWVIDPGEVVEVNNTQLTVDGNITLGAGSELHLEAVELLFLDISAKRALVAPEGSVVTITNSTVAAARGVAFGGSGYYLRVDGRLILERTAVNGLSGPTIPNPFAETEGVHLTNSSSRITFCSFGGSAGYAVTVTVLGASASPVISDNTFDNGAGGVYLGGFVFLGADALVERNSFTLNALPHLVTTGSSPTIRNNSFIGSSAGVAVLLGSPTIEGNTFIGTVLNAVSVTQGGGRIEHNTVTGAGIAFAVTGSTVVIRNNTVSLSGSALQASASTVTFDDNAAPGGLATALTANGSTVNAHGNVLESTLGSAVVRATNASRVTLGGGSLTSVGGSGVSVDGGTLTLEYLDLKADAAPLAATGAQVVLRSVRIQGGLADSVVWVRGGSLACDGGEITGGDDGLRLDGASASVNSTHIHGNGGYGIRASHIAPSLGADQVTAFINGNAEGDLLYEADLTVLVHNARHEPVANASITIEDGGRGTPLAGTTGPDGRAGPVRLPVRRIDSLNNEVSYGPYRVSASYPPDARGSDSTALDADDEVLITLAQNRPPTALVDGPEAGLVSELLTFQVNATDPDLDSLVITWNIDDGRTFAGPVIYLSFNSSGTRLLEATVSDGFAYVQARTNVTVLTAAEANEPPYFLSEPRLGATLGAPYSYDVSAYDPDSIQPVFLQLIEGPPGMTIRYGGTTTGTLSWSPAAFVRRTVDELNVSYPVVLRAYDGLGFAYQNFTVVLRNPPDAAPVIGSPPTLSVPSGTGRTLDLVPFVNDADDPASTLTWRVILPNNTHGALIGFDPRSPGLFFVQAPPGLEATVTLLVVVQVSDELGVSNSTVITVELQGAPPAAAPGDSAILATALALGAVGIAAFALLQRRRPPPPKE